MMMTTLYDITIVTEVDSIIYEGDWEITVEKTTTEQTTGTIQADVYDTHYGHTTDLKHLHLPDNIRVSIARQLPQGVSFQHILDYVDDNIGTNLK